MALTLVTRTPKARLMMFLDRLQPPHARRVILAYLVVHGVALVVVAKVTRILEPAQRRGGLDVILLVSRVENSLIAGESVYFKLLRVCAAAQLRDIVWLLPSRAQVRQVLLQNLEQG